MIKAIGRNYLRLLENWVDLIGRNPIPVLLLTTFFTAASLFYTGNRLEINTSTDDLLSSELQFRKDQKKLQDAFPNLRNNITIVIDGETPDLSEDAAAALSARLRESQGVFNFVIDFANDPFFVSNGLLYLDLEELLDLSDNLADAQPMLAKLSQDMSLRGLFEIMGLAVDEVKDGETDPERLTDAFDRLSETIERQQAGHPIPLSWREMMTGGENNKSDYRHFIIAQPKLDFSGLNPASDAIDTIREAATDLGLDAEHGVNVRLTGGVILEQEELESVFEGATKAEFLSFFLVAVIVALGFRSFRLVFATLVTLTMGLIWTAGWATFSVGQLNLISVAFAVLFIGIGVDFGIQYCLRYREEIGNGHSAQQALSLAASGVGGGISLAALTSAIGFFAFAPTAYVGLSELGIIAGGSMFIALFANLTILPAVLSLLPLKVGVRGSAAPKYRWLEIYSALFLRHARLIAFGALALGLVAAVVFLPRLYFDFDPMNLRDPSTESVQTALDIMEDGQRSTYAISVLAADLEVAQTQADEIESLALVDGTITLADYVPQDQEDKLAVIDDMILYLYPILDSSERLAPPDDGARRVAIGEFRAKLNGFSGNGSLASLKDSTRRLANALDKLGPAANISAADLATLEDQALVTLPNRLDRLRRSLDARLITLEDLPEDIYARNMTADGQALIEVLPSESMDSNEAIARFVNAVRAITPDATDNSVLLLEGGEAVMTAFKQAGTLSLILIFLLLLVVLRNLIDTVLVLLPLFLAVILTGSASVIFNIPLNFANIIAVPLLFSLGIDYGIYLVLRARESSSVMDIMQTSTPRAIFYSALTTMCAFGSLMVSDHRGTASMGQLLSISLTFALICTLVVLPALLVCRANWAQGKAEGDVTGKAT
ncbi:MAG: MMPL family transporter [Rhodospirillaceae bacterium]|nr:MMPL family transporter [Rhodospirillaceae bacterium]MBT5752195.1 MMPL family transporter [Rhodospirillaceae bacterium]